MQGTGRSRRTPRQYDQAISRADRSAALNTQRAESSRRSAASESTKSSNANDYGTKYESQQTSKQYTAAAEAYTARAESAYGRSAALLEEKYMEYDDE